MKSEGVYGEEGCPIAAAPRRERGGERSEEGCRVQGRRACAAPSPPGPACPSSVPASPGPRVLTPQTTGRLAGGSGPPERASGSPGPAGCGGRAGAIRCAQLRNSQGAGGRAPPRPERCPISASSSLCARPSGHAPPTREATPPAWQARPIRAPHFPQCPPLSKTTPLVNFKRPAPFLGATPTQIAPPRAQSLVQSCSPIS